MSGQEASLPKWAQAELARLRQDCEYWKAQALAGPDDSNVFVKMGGNESRPLGRDVRVDFRWPNRQHPERPDYIQVRHDDDGLYVAAGNDCIAVRPSASNSVRIDRVDHNGHKTQAP